MWRFWNPLWPEPKLGLSGTRSGVGGHEIHYQTHGSPKNRPVLFLHGGPGRGTQNTVWSFFNPRVYQVVLVDQRGCGRSTPLGSLQDNTTQLLVEDLEAVREMLGFEKWMIFGCGWGSTLGLYYAQRHPEHVSEIILNNCMTFRRKEIDWLFKYGASEFFPGAWREFMRPLEQAGLAGGILEGYQWLLTRGSERQRRQAVEAWARWEWAISGNPAASPHIQSYEDALVTARISCHYFVNGGFLQPDTQLIDGLGIIREHKIPGVIVHGEDDLVNPVSRAMELHEAWPEAEFVLVPGAGHSLTDRGIQKALVAATTKFGGCGCYIKLPNKVRRK